MRRWSARRRRARHDRSHQRRGRAGPARPGLLDRRQRWPTSTTPTTTATPDRRVRDRRRRTSTRRHARGARLRPAVPEPQRRRRRVRPRRQAVHRHRRRRLGRRPRPASAQLERVLGKILRIDPHASGDAAVHGPGRQPVRRRRRRHGRRSGRSACATRGGSASTGDRRPVDRRRRPGPVEEVDVAWAADGGGQGLNFGWSAFEGNHRFNDDQSADGSHRRSTSTSTSARIARSAAARSTAAQRSRRSSAGTCSPTTAAVRCEHCRSQTTLRSSRSARQGDQRHFDRRRARWRAVRPVERRRGLFRDSLPDHSHSLELRGAARDVGRHHTNPKVIARREVLSIESGDDGQVAQLDTRPAIVDVGDNRREGTLRLRTQQRDFRKIDDRSLDLVRRVIGTSHDVGQLGNAAAICSGTGLPFATARAAITTYRSARRRSGAVPCA